MFTKHMPVANPRTERVEVACPSCEQVRVISADTIRRTGGITLCRQCSDLGKRGKGYGGRKRTLADKTCPTCGETFHPYGSKAKYCSLKCRPAPPHKNQIEKQCERCGATFYVPQCRKDAKYCKQSCTRNRVKLDCAHCGKPFERTKSSTAGKNGWGYCTKECQGLARRKQRRYDAHGYIVRWCPESPHAGKRGMVLEHREVMANYLGRPLHPDETVHHKNGRRDDNRVENLELWVSRHQPGQRVSDRVADAIEILERYAPEVLAEDTIQLRAVA